MTERDPSWISELGIDLDRPEWLNRLREARESQSLGEIAGYELEAEVGRGGQGIVYRAKHNGGSVAVKRILSGPFASPERQRRFEREVEAVRSLDHPGIVRLLDSLSVREASILVMEWIEGTPITEWTRPGGKRRSVADIVAMMRRVCDAVLFAHQRGVIHRDLKPSNLLVGGDAQPRLLDFGLAKLRGDAPVSTLTSAGGFLGTLAYASPEQVEGDPDAVDARSDVYSLGVILYEMLTGEPPYRVDGSIAAAIRAVTTEDPPPPSSLAPDVDRSLDAVVSKALAKDPVQRYQSADAFAHDLQRCVDGEPVAAKPRSATYVLERFVRRHPVTSAVVGGLALLVVGFGATMGFLYQRSEREALRALRVQSFLETTLVASRPTGDPTEAIHILDRAAARLGPELAGEPAIEMRIHSGLARRYLEVRGYEQASHHAERALTLADEVGEGGEEARMSALRVLGLSAIFREDSTSVDWLRQALAIHRDRHGDDHLVVAEIRHHLGYAYWKCCERPELASAERELLASISTFAKLREAPNWREADANLDYANFLFDQGEAENAVGHYKEALRIVDALPADTFVRMRVMILQGLGSALSRAGRWGEMELTYRRALDLRGGELDGGAPICHANVGNSFFYRERYEEALVHYDDALVARLELLSQDHPAYRPDLVLLAADVRTHGIRASIVPEAWRLIGSTDAEILPLFQFTSGKVADCRAQLGDELAARAIRRALAEVESRVSVRSPVPGPAPSGPPTGGNPGDLFE